MGPLSRIRPPGGLVPCPPVEDHCRRGIRHQAGKFPLDATSAGENPGTPGYGNLSLRPTKKLSKRKITGIYDSLEYMTNRQNAVWIGGTGTGKTGLATAFLIHAVNRGYSGRFIPFPDLIEQLHQSLADGSEGKLIKKLASCDCLSIDELGYVEIEPVQVGLFFTLMNKRHKRKSTLATSNLSFSEWTQFLKNDQLTAALIDRLTENSHVINMRDCVSLRPKLASK
ncbi:MAG: ATP-binding protein [Proteobacteria bacterium]|nr:ATP-binding protein [Pseudomonadota bacterium]